MLSDIDLLFVCTVILRISVQKITAQCHLSTTGPIKSYAMFIILEIPKLILLFDRIRNIPIVSNTFDL